MLFWQQTYWGVMVDSGICAGENFAENVCLFLHEYSLNWGAHLLWNGYLNTFSAAWWGVLLIGVVTIFGLFAWVGFVMLSGILTLLVAVVLVLMWMVAELFSYFWENPY